MTPEEQLIQKYFQAFNRHDIEGVMACFDKEPTLVHGDGKRIAGLQEVRRQYESEFAMCPDGRCELRLYTGNNGRAVAESLFHGTSSRDGKVIEAIGAEVMEIVNGKIKEIRDYHQPLPARAA